MGCNHCITVPMPPLPPPTFSMLCLFTSISPLSFYVFSFLHSYSLRTAASLGFLNQLSLSLTLSFLKTLPFTLSCPNLDQWLTSLKFPLMVPSFSQNPPTSLHPLFLRDDDPLPALSLR